MTELPLNLGESEKLTQAAIRCYLSLLLAATDSMAVACPEVGVAFKRRWARAPQRIGFELSVESIEESAQAFEHDLRAFGKYAGPFFQPAPPLLRGIAGRGSIAVGELLVGLVSHCAKLRALAESMSAVVQSEETPDPIRTQFEHQIAGLRNCADKMEFEAIPQISELQATLLTCQDLVERSNALSTSETGVLNQTDFSRELMRRRALGSLKSLVRLDVRAELRDGEPCSDEQFAELARNLAGLVREQFDSDEAIGLVGREFLILSSGTMQDAMARETDIVRELSGPCRVSGVRIDIDVQMYAADSPSEDWANKWLSDPEDVPVEFPIRASEPAPYEPAKSHVQVRPSHVVEVDSLEIEMVWLEEDVFPLVSA